MSQTSESQGDLQKLYITCPKGIEELLAAELQQLGALEVKPAVAAVMVQASVETTYRIVLWSRLANRVVRLLNEGTVQDKDDLYHLAEAAYPKGLISPALTMAVDFNGSNSAIRHSQYGAQLVKDAISDAMYSDQQQRPEVDVRNADVRWYVRLFKQHCVIGVDVVGESLHRRGYRQSQGAAPLKENLAAAIVMRSGYPRYAQEQMPVLDPMCGSGTLLIEAAMQALDVAPGLLRKQWAFLQFSDANTEVWHAVLTDAEQRRESALRNCHIVFAGCDSDASVLRVARDNAKRAGLDHCIHFFSDDVYQPECPWRDVLGERAGMLLCNPPYGERLGEKPELIPLYEALGRYMSNYCRDWRAAILTSEQSLSQALGLRRDKRYRFFNGALRCELSTFVLDEGNHFVSQADKAERIYTEDSLPPGADMVCNRLKKNRKRLKRFLQSEQINAYRVYDADLPEYAAIVDCYQCEERLWLHVQEYAAPGKVDQALAARRFKAIVAAASCAFQCPVSHIVTKQRRRQRGSEQYDVQRNKVERTPGAVVVRGETVREHGHRFLVNFTDYLDTGLFIDHRALRQRVQREAKGRKFLNLFCYTAAFTVYAVKGGASQTVSVDMSNTYLSWAKQNFELNGIDPRTQQLVRADCLQWLQMASGHYDMILLDPPSFSNSKKMDETLDIQRDHAELIRLCMLRLNPGGQLYFSNNKRGFKLDASLAENYSVKDITQETLDPDVRDRRLPHQCWQIEHPAVVN